VKDKIKQYRLLRLILGAMDASLTAEQFAELDALLRRDPEAMDFYGQVMRMQTVLTQSRELFVPGSDEAILNDSFWNLLLDDQYKAEPAEIKIEELKAPAVPLSPVPKSSDPVSKTPLAVALSALAAFLILAAYVYFNPKNPASLVGRLTRTVDAQWANATGTLKAETDLYAGPLHLTKGYAELYTENGSQVILQAPVELYLESPSQILVRQGRMTVYVKSGVSNFVVRTPTASIVDFGTEFGVYVDEQLNTMTYVYQGAVELRSGSNPLKFEHRLALSGGQGGLADVRGDLVFGARSAAARFMRSEEFGYAHMAVKGSDYYRWKAYSLRLRRDPDVAAYYTFEKNPDQSDKLLNVAEATGGDLNGRLFSTTDAPGPAWTQGRWPEKTALAFDGRLGQYVEVPADERLAINGPITVAAWIYRSTAEDGGHILANRVPDKTISRFSRDSICNYQLGYRSPSPSRWKQHIHLARKRGTDDYKNQPCSPSLPDVLGWTLVAATHDNETLKFYLNGSLVDTQHWPLKQELVVAELVIGTDFIGTKENRFNGIMDEIVIARRVFSEQEIAEMYQAGKP